MSPRPDDDDYEPQGPGRGFTVDPDDRVYYASEPDVPARRFGMMRIVVILVVAVGSAAALWLAYSKGRDAGGGGPVPLIRAEEGATKVKPDQPGGEQVPDQDKYVYQPDQAGAKVEHLLPPPEEPMAKPEPSVTPPPGTYAPVAGQAPPPLPEQQVGTVSDAKAAPPTPAGAVLPPATSSGMLTSPPGAKAAPVADDDDEGTPVTAPGKPTALAPSAPRSAPVAKPVAAATPAPVKAGAGDGIIRVQLAATKDEAAGHAEWERLKKANPDLLGDLSPILVKADLGDRGVFYRVQAGPISDHAAAEKLCVELKKRSSIGCIIVKP